jgi:iron complex outermembrane receptor protein
MPRGAVGNQGASLLHFLSQREFGLRGRTPGEETLKRSIIAALITAAAPFALAQSPEEPAVVVTATRFPESRLEAPIGMTVITARQIAESAAKTLPELLSREAGILTRDNTGSPDWQIDMRGFGITGDQNTLVLLDGQRLNENELVSVRWSAIPIESIERIEIMRGSGSVLYGGGATGGTINIITKTPQPDASGASAGASVGTYGTREFRGGATVTGEHTGLTLYANDYVSDNYRFNNRIEQRNVEGTLRWFEREGSVAFKFGLDNQNLRLPGARTAEQLQSDPRGTSTPGDFSTRDGARATLAVSHDLGFGEFATELGYRDSVRTSLFKDYSGFGADTYTETRTSTWSFTPRLKIPYGALGFRHSLVVGIDADDWGYDSRKATSRDTLGNPTARVFATQRNEAIYVQQNTAIGEDTKLTLGAREHRVTTTARDVVNPAAYASGSKTSTPHAWDIALRQNLTRTTAVYGRVGESFRIATVDEVYNQFGGPSFDAIVTLLEPQTSREHEIGLEYRVSDLRIRASAFLIDLKNEIYFFAPTFSNINLPPTRRKGVELDASLRASPILSLFGNVSATQARFRDGQIGGVDVSGNTIPLVPRNAANAGFSWLLFEGTRLNGVARYVGRQYYDNDQTNSFPDRMPAYVTVDLKVTHVLRNLSLSLGVNNILNKQYYSYAIRNGAGTSFNAYPQPDQTLLASAEYRF